MSVAASDIIPVVLVFLLTGGLTALFAKKRIETSVNALDWLMAIFGSVALLSLAQLFKTIFIGKVSFFVPDNIPRSLDIVTMLNLVTLLILYFMVESFLAERPNPIRLTILTMGVTIFLSIGLFYISTGQLITLRDVVPFGKDGKYFDAFLFDSIQLGIIILVFYTFTMQYQMSDNATVRRYLTILLIAIALFGVASITEVLEYFWPYGDISAFLMSIPTFVLLAYFYYKNSNFIYLAPANIAFLQIVKRDGTLIYAAELSDELQTNDFLIAPSLTSVSSIISELVNSEQKEIELEKFVYSGGYILFEQLGDLRAILQTDRPSQILKRSMRYFLREFHRLFADQVEHYKGYIDPSEGVSPDALFGLAIPIVMSRQLRSSFSEKSKTDTV